jgi:general secretion pathway protein G
LGVAVVLLLVAAVVAGCTKRTATSQIDAATAPAAKDAGFAGTGSVPQPGGATAESTSGDLGGDATKVAEDKGEEAGEAANTAPHGRAATPAPAARPRGGAAPGSQPPVHEGGIAKPAHQGGEDARVAKSKADIQTLMSAVEMYQVHCGDPPSQSDGLTALVRRPSSSEAAAHWHGPYLQKGVPKDGWGRDYLYRSLGRHSSDFDIISTGQDGREGTEDDINSWDLGPGAVGPAGSP